MFTRSGGVLMRGKPCRPQPERSERQMARRRRRQTLDGRLTRAVEVADRAANERHRSRSDGGIAPGLSMLPRTRAPGMRRGRRGPPRRTPGGCALRAPMRTPEQRSRVAASRPRPLRRSVRAIDRHRPSARAAASSASRSSSNAAAECTDRRSASASISRSSSVQRIPIAMLAWIPSMLSGISVRACSNCFSASAFRPRSRRIHPSASAHRAASRGRTRPSSARIARSSARIAAA